MACSTGFKWIDIRSSDLLIGGVHSTRGQARTSRISLRKYLSPPLPPH